MGNVGINSVGTESVYQTRKVAEQNVSRVSREMALRARYSRDIAVSIWPDSSHSSMCKAHELLRRMLSCELPAKTLYSSIA